MAQGFSESLESAWLLAVRHFHFIGICGTAMGSVAAAMKRAGYEVTGSDTNVYPPMSTFLEGEGIQLFEGYKRSNIPKEAEVIICLLYTSPSPRDQRGSRMPSSA